MPTTSTPQDYTLTVDQFELSEILATAFENQHTIMITGEPGVGKSAIVRDACQGVFYDDSSVDDNQTYDLIYIHLVTSMPQDLQGMPAIINDQAVFLPFKQLKRIIEATEPTVVFLDDFGQAKESVQVAVMQMLQERRIDGHLVPDCVTFCIATNRREHNAGVSRGIIEPVKGRCVSIVHLQADEQQWCKWAIANGMPVELVAYVNYKQDLFSNFKTSRDMINFVCPRTLEHVGQILNAGYPKHLQNKLISGAAGYGFATEFAAIRELMSKLPSPDVLIADPSKYEEPKDNNGNIALSVIHVAAIGIAEKANAGNIGNVFEVASKFPKGLEVACITHMIRENKDLANTREYIAWQIDNQHQTTA